MRRVTGLNFFFSSPSVISILLLTSPSTVIFHASGSLLSSGMLPLLRTKNFSVGVVSSSSICSGVSATSGRSPSSTSLSLLPGYFRYCGPFGAAGAGGALCAIAAGIIPPGMLAANGIAPPTAAPIAAKPAPPRKPRRSRPVLRPNASASARSGSFA